MKFAGRKIARRLLITISFCFLMCLLPMCAHGAEYTDEDGTTWYYATPPEGAVYPYSGTALITECSRIPEDGILKIPASINGTAVTGINSHAFRNKEEICKVVLPKGFKYIGFSAFTACSNLKTISFPSSLETIEEHAFDSCGFETLDFPASLHCTIKDGAFAYNKALQTVTINGNVTFDLSAGSVFDGCNNGPGTGLQAFLVPDNNDSFKAVDGVLYSKDMTRLEAYPPARQGESYTVPDGVKTICSHAFSQNSLKNVSLPGTLTEIGGYAFQNSWKLAAAEIPSGVKKLGTNSFASCNYLGEVTLHEGLESIDEYAFFGCSRIYELELPEGLTTIGDNAFCAMSVLQKLYIPESVTEIGNNVFQATGNVTLYTTNETAAAYARENGIACETATVEEYRAVPTGQPQIQDPDPGTGSDPNPGNDPGPGDDNPDPPGPSDPDPTKPVKILKAQSISCTARFTKPIGKSFYLKAKAKTALKYKSSNRKVATVNTKGLVKITGYGTCKITITASKSGTYKAAKKTITIKGRLAKPVLKGVNVKTKKVKLTWSKVGGATGYKLYIKYPGAKKYALVLTKSARVKGVTHRRLSKKKTYCYKVRAYKKVGEKTVYSRYSNVIKVKIRK